MSAFRRLIRAAAIDIGPLRRHREFRLLYVGQAVSFAGSMITYVAIPFQVYDLTGSTLVVGLLGLAELIPLLGTALLGGALADAHDRRRLVLVADATLLFLALVLVGNALLADPHVWLLFVVAAGMSAAGGLQRPPLDAMLPRLVPREDLAAASALDGFRGNVGQIAGPALAGILIATVGLGATYAVDAASFLVSLAALARMRAVPGARRGGTAEPRADRGGPALRRLASGADRELCGRHQRDAVRHPDRAVPGGRRPLRRPGAARVALRRGPHGRGAVHARERLGLARAPPRQGDRAERRRLRRARSSCSASPSSLPLALVALAAAGASDMSSVIFRQTLWNQTIPDHMRGRMAGIEQLSYSIGPTLGTTRSGAVASVTSVPFSIAAGGAVCIAGTIALSALLPRFWRYEARDPVSA